MVSAFALILLACLAQQVLSGGTNQPKYAYDPSTAKYCTFWYDNDDGSVACQDIPNQWFITDEQWIRWNPVIAASCGNFVIGKSYCIEASQEPISAPPATLESTTSGSSSSTSLSSSTATKPNNGISTPTPTQPGMVDNCNKFYWVSLGERCQDIASKNGIPLTDFLNWKPKAGQKCGSLWADTYACVSVMGYKPQPTPSKPDNSVKTPSPTQPGIVDNCDRFYLVQAGDSCVTVAANAGISVADLLKWNPQAGSQCTGLWANAYACTGTIPAFRLRTRYHNDCTGAVYNDLSVNDGTCIRTGCSVASLDISPEGYCPDGQIQISYWEKPDCTAIGFDLGQSYGTAVTHFSNGTVLKLAKVEGSQRYQAFLQSELQKQQEAWWYPPHAEIQREDLSRLLKQYMGIGGPDGAVILAEMLIALRTSSEAVLGAPLPATVVITAPYIIAWSYEETLQISYIKRAQKLAGLRTVKMESMTPVYLGEANTILAANRRMLCPDLFCNGPEWTNKNFHKYDVVYLVSLTNHSLYTSFQISTCFFWPARSAQLGTINPRFGLNQLEQASDQEIFWRELQDHLKSRVREYVKQPDNYRESFLVVVSGEAADNPKVVEAIRGIITDMEKDPAFRVVETGRAPRIELLISEDPTYAAAKGVAFGQRINMDSRYCNDWFEREKAMGGGRDEDSRDEL
ncbi:LysM domain protein [Metarhizium brunneum]